MHNTDNLKQCLLQVCHGMDQSIIESLVDEWFNGCLWAWHCVQVNDAYCEQFLWQCQYPLSRSTGNVSFFCHMWFDFKLYLLKFATYLNILTSRVMAATRFCPSVVMGNIMWFCWKFITLVISERIFENLLKIWRNYCWWVDHQHIVGGLLFYRT